MAGGCRVLAHGEQQWEPDLNPAGATQFWPGIKQFWPAAAPPGLNLARNRTNSSGDLLRINSFTTLACQIGASSDALG